MSTKALGVDLVGARAISVNKHGPDSQNLRLLSHWECDGTKLRVRIQIDRHYLSQSRDLVCEIWSPPAGWIEISTIAYAEIGEVDLATASGKLRVVEAKLLERAIWALKS